MLLILQVNMSIIGGDVLATCVEWRSRWSERRRRLWWRHQ